MGEIICLEKYRTKKESTNTGSDEEFAALEANVWRMCQALGMDKFLSACLAGMSMERKMHGKAKGDEEEKTTTKI